MAAKTSIQSSYVEQRSVSAAIAAAAELISVVLKDKQLEALLAFMSGKLRHICVQQLPCFYWECRPAKEAILLHRHEHEPGAAVAGNHHGSGHEWAVVYIAPT